MVTLRLPAGHLFRSGIGRGRKSIRSFILCRMQSLFIPYKASSIHYLKGGKGPAVLLCFHGYGESSASFDFLEESIGNEYTILAVDLPYHGRTEWREGPRFSEDDLVGILGGIIAVMPPAEGMSIIGYSMGGRIAMALAEKKPEQTKKLLLLAPDGLKTNPWYWLATQTGPGNRLFRFTMRHPGWFFSMARIARFFGVLNKSVHRFIQYSLIDKGVRQLLYIRWTCMAPFRPRPNLLRKSLQRYKIPVEIAYGEFDRVIRPAGGIRLRKGIENLCRIQILPCGHQLLAGRNKDVILDWLNLT
jgi:pimeloyl-ACP methyl ester carboxylesterase